MHGESGKGGDGAAERDGGLRVRSGLVIPESEIERRASRSGGPGGQNVNKLATRVELRFDLRRSSVLNDDEKRRVRARLAGRISRSGILRVVAQQHRSRSRNEAAARERLAELLREALHQARARRATRPSTAVRQRRLVDKRRRSTLKRERGQKAGED